MIGGDIRQAVHRLTTMDQSLFSHPAVQKHLAEIGSGRWKGRVMDHGQTELLECLVILARLAQGKPQVVVSWGEIRPQFQGAAIMVDGLCPLPESLQCQAKIAQSFRKVRTQIERRAAATDRPFQLAQGTINLGEIGVKGRHVRLQGHRFTNGAMARRWSPC